MLIGSCRGRAVGALLAAAFLALGSAAWAQEFDKVAAHARMIDLERAIEQARIADDAAALAAALQELNAVSASLGGDLPVASGTPSVGVPNAPRVAPPPPQGGVITSTGFTQATPTAIPTGPAVVTSTVVVSGAQTYLWDVDLLTTITHTFAADLDITLTSPAGTTVTLTTDNGAGNDNVFNGTLWDDQANPAGQVPYVTNNGLVSDHAYVNLTLASPLVPEEAMTAFRGEDPNGTWTITISDDLAGDGGSLANWTLTTHTLPGAPVETVTSFTQATPTAIPTGPAVVTSTVVVSGVGVTATKIRLTTNLTHTFAADLDITLQGPTGAVVTLTTDNGAGNDNTYNGTLWDDDANPAGVVPYVTNNGLATDHAYVNLTTATPLVIEEAMGAFNGLDPNGTWTITISDDLAGDGGTLASWTLEVTTGVSCVLTCPANVTASNDPNQCGAVINYPPPGATAACGTVTCSPASGSFFPVGSTAATCTASVGPTCGFNVTVNDTQPPTNTCPANQTAAATSAAGATVNFPPPTASDNCPGVTVVCAPASGSTFPIGTTTDTCTATDASSNTATCSFSVDVIAPDIAITKTSSATGPVPSGTNVTFTLTASNTSTVDAQGVQVVDPIQGGLTYVSNSCGATFASGTVTWTIGTLAAGASLTCDIVVTVVGGGNPSNSATISSSGTFDANGANNTGTTGLVAFIPPVPTLATWGAALLAIGLLLVALRRARRA